MTDNTRVVEVLDEIADLLEFQGQSSFRVRAYRSAARIVEALGQPVARLSADALAELPGIAKDLAGKIEVIAQTGTHPVVAELCMNVPETVVRMMRIPGVGPKRAKLLYDNLGLTSIEALARAARDGKLDEVRGFGPTLQRKILEATSQIEQRPSRTTLVEADARAAPLVAWLKGSRCSKRVELAGSLRRRKETIGDLDVLVASDEPAKVAERFLHYPEVKEVLARGEGKCSIRLSSGMQADLRVVAPESFGAALHYFTGSKAHNIAIRKLGVRAGLKINEYGVFRGKKRISGADEEDVFRAVGLPFIPPELREDRGEVEAAKKGLLPELVALDDLRGELHLLAADEALVRAAAAKGYSYVAVSGTQRQLAALRRKFPRLSIFHYAEIDLAALDRAPIEPVDFSVATVPQRGSLDIAAIAREAAHHGVLLDVEGDAQMRVAKDEGALLIVSSDAHDARELDRMRYAVDRARRGWCTANNIANTRSPAALRKLLERRTKPRAVASGY